MLPSNAPIQLTTKSIALRKDLTSNLPRREDINWTTHPNSRILKAIVANLRARSALMSFSEWNSATPKRVSDEILSLTQDSLLKEKHDPIPTEIQEPLRLTGMKLTAGSQRLFYLNIRLAHNPAKERRRTVMNMALTQHAVFEISGKMPSREQVWMSIRDRDIPKSIRGFLWKSIHGAYKIGEFWDKIPNYEQRGQCSLCRSPESMEHILLDCNSLASRTIWKAAKDLWCKREVSWPNIRFGTILGCSLITFNNENGKKITGKSRLFNILGLVSAHLIWKLRCERTIKYKGNQEKFHSETEIYNRWLHAINTRLKFDRLLTDSKRYGKKALKVETVLKTWSGLLLHEENLPDNWVHNAGVLVGMAPRCPPGRNR